MRAAVVDAASLHGVAYRGLHGQRCIENPLRRLPQAAVDAGGSQRTPKPCIMLHVVAYIRGAAAR